MRYAIYFTPRHDDPLTRIASSWLGRDAFTGAQIPVPTVATLSEAEIAFHTASARRYGFHATLKAPFHLAGGASEADLDAELARFAAGVEQVVIPRLVLKRLDGFLALVTEGPVPDLDRFAGEVVTHFDRFRAPLSEADIRRRNPDALGADAFRNLLRWGYPYVFESFRFHMTLTGRVADAELPHVRAAVEEAFASALDRPVAIDGLALFVEPEPGAPFIVRSWHALGNCRERKTA